MGQNKPFLWKSHCKQLGWARKLGEAGPQGITRVGQTVRARLMESQIWCLLTGSVVLSRGRAQQRNNGLCQHFCLGESCPPSSRPDAGQCSSSHKSLVSFNLLPPSLSSEGVGVSKSKHGPFKRSCLGLQKFLCSTASVPAGFHSQKLWRFIFLALDP